MSYLRSKAVKAATYARDVLLETLWPTRCAVCDLPCEEVLCEGCRDALVDVDECLACPVCGAPYGVVQCTECNDVVLSGAGLESLPVESMRHALVLDDAARRMVSAYKDADERRLRAHISGYMARHVSPDLAMEGYVISYIPDTKEAYRRRGFDHSLELAECLSETTGLPCMRLFLRPGSTDQRTLGRRERAANMQRAISVDNAVDLPEKVLLVDDVCTTGATVFSAAKALRDAGVGHVRALTFAQVLDT